MDQDYTILSDELSLSYLADYANEGVYFNLTDKLSGESKVIGFDIRYWQSFQTDIGQNSGVYIFRPAAGQYDSY